MLLNKIRSKRGFTLIELVMVIVIVGTLTSVSSMYIRETINLWRMLSFRNEVISIGRMALKRMAREMRQMKLRTQSYEPIQEAQAGQLRFVFKDGAVETDVQYSLSGTDLMRNNITVSNNDILAKNITGLQFCYYNKTNGNACASGALCACTVPTANLADIYRIVVKMDISSVENKHLETQVFPRNLN